MCQGGKVDKKIDILPKKKKNAVQGGNRQLLNYCTRVTTDNSSMVGKS